jgi:uracil-DNA glycosylase
MNDAARHNSLDNTLDERQRSMLEAMGITLWLPPAAKLEEKSLAFETQPVQRTTEVVANPIAQLTQRSAPESVATAPTPAAKMPLTSVPDSIAASASYASRPKGIEHMDWLSLQDAVSSCRACSLCESRKNTVFGVGEPPLEAALAPQVDWLIVGEAPGENEDARGEPFVGQSGKLLDNMLAAMKIGKEGQSLSRKEGVYIANVIKCRPPDNRNPSAQEIATCEPYLARQISLLRPKIILAMGKFAIASVTGSNEPVGKLRGRVHKLNHPSYAAPVIVTYHPAYMLRNLPDKAKAWADLLLAMQIYSELPKP